MSQVQHKKRRKTIRYQLQTFKLLLFGRDVLSIIDSYYAEGFDEWSQSIKSLNTEYFSHFDVEANGTLSSKNGFYVFNFRHNTPYDNEDNIYHYNFKIIPLFRNAEIHNTNIVINYKKYF